MFLPFSISKILRSFVLTGGISVLLSACNFAGPTDSGVSASGSSKQASAHVADNCRNAIADARNKRGPTVADCIKDNIFGSDDDVSRADAGYDQSAVANEEIFLHGQGVNLGEGLLTYQWQQTAGQWVSLSDAYAALISFVAPESPTVEQLVFELTVTTESGDVYKDQVAVMVGPLEPASKSPVLVSASSLATDSAQFDWLGSVYAAAVSDDVFYTIHISTEADFVPTGATAKRRVQGTASAGVTGLAANTRYYAKVQANKPSSHASWSNEISFVTASADPQLQAGQSVVTLDANNASTIIVSDDRVDFELLHPASLPAVGDIIIGREGDGFIRRVDSVNKKKGRLYTVMTSPASLNEVFSEFAISSNTKLVQVPEELNAASPAKALLASSLGKSKQSKRWPKTGLELESISTTSQLDTNNISRALQTFDPVTNQQTESTYDLSITALKSVLIEPGKGLQLNVAAETIQRSVNEYRITSVVLKSVEPPKGKDMPNYQIVEFFPTNTDTRQKRQFVWVPNSKDVHKDMLPYVVTFVATAEKRAGCGVINLNGCRQSVEISVPIYVGWDLPPKETGNNVSTDSDFSIENSYDINFQPTIAVDAVISSGSLQSASVAAKGTATLEVETILKAMGNASIEGQFQIAKRKFAQIYTVGPVPILVKGELILRAEYEAGATANLDMKETMTFNYDMDVGLKYDAITGWQTYSTVKDKYRLAVEGGADVEANAVFRLVPDLTVTFYEAATGQMILEPYIFADAGIEGKFKFLGTGEFVDFDAMYRFTALDAGTGMEAKLRADFTIFSYSVAGWPSKNKNDFTEFEVFEKKPWIGLPEFQLYAAPSSESNADYPGAVKYTAAIEDKTFLQKSPLYNGSAQWHIFPDSGNVVIDTMPLRLEGNSERYDAWFCLDVTQEEYDQTYQYETYEIRFSGHSSWGSWAMQYAKQDEVKLPRCQSRYVKLGAGGQPLNIQNAAWDNVNGSEADGTKWSCVEDTDTGLIWEIKQDYEFYLQESSWMEYGSAVSYANSANVISLCGRNNWRIPNITQHETIMNCEPGVRSLPMYYGLGQACYYPNTPNAPIDWHYPAVNWEYFPELQRTRDGIVTGNDNLGTGGFWFWSSTDYWNPDWWDNFLDENGNRVHNIGDFKMMFNAVSGERWYHYANHGGRILVRLVSD